MVAFNLVVKLLPIVKHCFQSRKVVKKPEEIKPLTECLCLPGGPFGYNEVAMIPAGATHIRVTDNSKNYLGKIQPVSHTQLSSETHWLRVNQAL